MKRLLYLFLFPALVFGQGAVSYNALNRANQANALAGAALVAAQTAQAAVDAAELTLASNLEDISAITNLTAGNVLISDGTNFVAEPITQLVSATAWDDLVIPGVDLRVNASPPALAAIFSTGNLLGYSFDDSTDEQGYFTLQFPHSWKEGTVIYPHVHWMAATTNTGSATWGFEYNWANVSSNYASGPATIIAVDATGGQWNHQIAAFPAITNTAATVSSVLVGRFFRDANASESGATDDLTGDAVLLSLDIHIQVDGLGSSEQYTK